MNMVYLAGDYVTTAVGDDNGAFVSAEGSGVTIDDFYIADSELTYAKWREVYE